MKIPRNRLGDNAPCLLGRHPNEAGRSLRGIPNQPYLLDPCDHHRAVFQRTGLTYGRSLGSKRRYAQGHPRRFFLPNACALTRDGSCVWRGDLDLATAGDRHGLVAASHMLNRKLFIMREGGDEIRSLPRTWLSANAVAGVWRGRVETMGYTRRLHGTLAQVARISLMKSSIPQCEFFSALNCASRDDFLPLQDYLTRLQLHLRVAAQNGECAKFNRHVDYLLITAALAAICGWDRKYRKWSQRLGRMLSTRMPPDLYRALRRINLNCRDRAPKQRVLINAPARWRSRAWLLAPMPEDRLQRRE